MNCMNDLSIVSMIEFFSIDHDFHLMNVGIYILSNFMPKFIEGPIRRYFHEHSCLIYIKMINESELDFLKREKSINTWL